MNILRWNWKFGAITLAILLIEIAIALWVRDRFIRPFLGDVLVVVLLYFGLRTALNTSRKYLAIAVLAFACSVEILQYFELVQLLGLDENRLARIILGSTFDPLDLMAYVVGVAGALFVDYRFIEKKK